MDNFFSTLEAANFLNISIRTFKYWIKATSTRPVQSSSGLQLDLQNFEFEYLRLIESDIADSQQHLDELSEPDRRGLTLATLRHFHCGFLPDWVLIKSRAELSCGLYVNENTGKTKPPPPPSPRIIIPIAGSQYFNAVVTRSARLSMNKRYWKQHAGVMELFLTPTL